jgi:hypothetical protein
MPNDSLFGALTSHEKKENEGLILSKSFLYWHIDAHVEVVMFLLLWWKEHEKKIPNVEILGPTKFFILNLEIETKMYF